MSAALRNTPRPTRAQRIEAAARALLEQADYAARQGWDTGIGSDVRQELRQALDEKRRKAARGES